MSYAQHMKHWKNHSKDKFHQQCAPVVTAAGVTGKRDYEITTDNGEKFFVTAYTHEHAEEMFKKSCDDKIVNITEG